ncbi:methyl-accepting chemotaxis protein [Paenibacillus albidus]|uniref:methyl-accepting chemotaxis protein n=1 Tax=Paenibacillus albidus TaxID=2041023 RepID=UPI001BEB7ABC|nr:methyl-accepting chemotaxis protein [Paenibacillus albidus]MBT2289971.1 methyl-accepting chemotaxis protein [Paenibacillus albidus]
MEDIEVKGAHTRETENNGKKNNKKRNGPAADKRAGSIQTKWSLVILALAVVPLLGVTIFFLQYFGGVTRSDSEQLAQKILEMNTTRIDEWLQSKTSAVQELVAAHPEFEPARPASLFPTLQVLEESDSKSEGYSVINTSGLLTNSMKMTADMGTADYFLKAKQTLSPAVADMSFLEPMNKYIIPVIVPMVDASKQFTGGVAFSVTPDILTEMSKNIHVGETGYGYVVSGKGEYYTYPDAARIGKTLADYAKTPEMQNTVKLIMSENSGTASYEGENGQGVITYFKTIPGTDWKLLITVPENEIYAKVTSAQQLALVIMLAVILLVVLISLYLTRRIVKPIVAISAVTKKVTEGHLNERVAVRSDDEIGRMSKDINEMIGSLSGLVSKIDTVVVQVADSSEGLLQAANFSSNTSAEIATVTLEVAQGVEDQFKGSEQSARATEEMAVGLQRIAESSVKVSDQAETVNSEVENGYHEIESTLQQMHIINTTANQAAEAIRQLTEQSVQIGDIVEVISEISNQTGLLSLNASIEAARAGEHGRGFGVVANEVKKLAERTNQSVIHIVELIGQIQSSTTQAADSMERSISEIGDGMAKMNNVGVSFGHIRQSIREVSQQIQDVSAINEEMSAGTEEITASVTDMLTIARESAENVQAIAEASTGQTEIMKEIVSSAESLTKLMSGLKQEIGRFRQ